MALIRDSVCVPTYKSQPKILKYFRNEVWTQKIYVLALRILAKGYISDLSENIL